MVKQVQKKIIKISYQCEVCFRHYDQKHHADAHETECYELQELEK